MGTKNARAMGTEQGVSGFTSKFLVSSDPQIFNATDFGRFVISRGRATDAR
jgi:hypothetical protein